MKSIFFALILLAILPLSACISIPREHHIVSQRGYVRTVQGARDCDIVQFKNISNSAPAQKLKLDSRGFKILTWNVLKGIKEGWKKDFINLTRYKDILTIQEARLTDNLHELLKKGDYNWDISTAFKINGTEVGVLTASRFEPDFICTFRISEPLTTLPKTAMITRYPLSDTNKSLMVVNIHSINFTLGTESFNRQLQKVENVLKQHTGPIIFSGDVNTWSKTRRAILNNLSLRLNLKAVVFNDHYRTKVFGNDVDHIYFRGLTIDDTSVIKVKSSDHNPMLVSFKLEES